MSRGLFFMFLFIHLALAKKHPIQQPPDQPQQHWATLTGEKPLVVARGGLSGVFPESSTLAYEFALSPESTADVVYCDLQLTKDGIGICQRDIRLDNSTNIAVVFPKKDKTYDVNGQQVRGYFALDYTEKELLDKVQLTQSVLTRTYVFDDYFPLMTPDAVASLKPPQFWLNVPYDAFYTLHNLNIQDYVVQSLPVMRINYISSPEIGFLKSIGGKVKGTKLIFQFLGGKAIEPTTKQEYSAILKDLATVKAFASGILVPKEFILPVGPNKYLEASTTLVADAHKLGLEVYASGFANDMPGSYNYSYDPVTEYLHYVENPTFAVDGVLTDFHTTALEAINCVAHTQTNKPGKGPLVISHNGASGVYPPSSDLAYQQAVEDGADIIDCSVQLSKDGVAFCLSSPDLMGETNAQTTFMPRAAAVPEIQPENGIFSFDLTASEIQGLTPQIPVASTETGGLLRNPANKNNGKITTLAEFLDLAKTKAVSGILIDIGNAPYLASKKGLSVTDIVAKALANATFDKQITQQVLIQSEDTGVLSFFRNVSSYKKVLSIPDYFSDAPKQSVDEIKKFADAVNIRRPSIVTTSKTFITTGMTDVVDKMHAGNVSVYVSEFRNEYTSIPIDFYADPYIEMATYDKGTGIDGFVTDYPATASAYRRSPCSNPDANPPNTFMPLQPGSFLQLIPNSAVLPPAESPAPVLKPSDVVDPPLPPVLDTSIKTPADGDVPEKGAAKSGQPANAVNLDLCLLFTAILGVLTLGFYQ